MTSFTAKSPLSQSNLAIVFVVYPGIKLLDLAGPLQAFVDTVDECGNAAYRTAVVSIDGALTTTDTPVSLSTESLSLWSAKYCDRIDFTVSFADLHSIS
jgi:transcriptional regulator GlxA family with amidase domain